MFIFLFSKAFRIFGGKSMENHQYHLILQFFSRTIDGVLDFGIAENGGCRR